MAKSKPKPTVVANGKAAPLSPLDVLTLTEAAAYLRLPEDAVREEAEVGRLVGQHVRGEWRFARVAVAAWLQAPRAPARPKTGAELVERFRQIQAASLYPPETEEETEEFIRKIYAARKADSAAG